MKYDIAMLEHLEIIQENVILFFSYEDINKQVAVNLEKTSLDNMAMKQGYGYIGDLLGEYAKLGIEDEKVVTVEFDRKGADKRKNEIQKCIGEIKSLLLEDGLYSMMIQYKDDKGNENFHLVRLNEIELEKLLEDVEIANIFELHNFVVDVIEENGKFREFKPF